MSDPAPMSVTSVMTVCIGNICRSPLAAAALARACPGIALSSAGLHAPEGAPADDTVRGLAAEAGLDLSAHAARPFRPADAARADLILVMEPGHTREILARAPHLGGRVMLLSRWTDNAPIPDPYRKPIEAHRHAAAQILAAADAWALRLNGAA